MDFVEIGHRIIELGQITNGVDRRHIAIHGINAFKRDQLWRVSRCPCQEAFKMRQIIMSKHALLTARAANAFNHGGVVLFVGENDAAGQDARHGGQSGIIGDIARREQKSCFLLVQIGQLIF